jgi:regulatory protein
MLARRELSEAQVRQRLARAGYAADAVDDAIGRLIADGAIDDRRAAETIAHAEMAVRRRGRLRARQRIQAAGIAPETAARAVDRVLETIDADALLEAAVARRLRGRARAADERELQRLYRFLVGQGFEPDRVHAALVRRRPSTARS